MSYEIEENEGTENEEFDGEEGGALSPTTDTPLPKGREPAAKVEPEAPAKGDLSERLQKAEKSVRRHKETSTRNWEKLRETESALTAKEQALKEYQEKLAYYEERINRIKGGDASVLDELGTSLEDMVRRALNPELAREERIRRSVQEEVNAKLRVMEQEMEQRKAAEAEARYEQEVSTFLGIVRSGEDTYADLAILEPAEQVAIGEAVAQELVETLGRTPKLSEVVKEANRRLAAYHKKVLEAHTRRTKTEKAPAKVEPPAKAPLRRQVLDAPKPSPSTITSQLSGQRGAKVTKLTPEERRRIAVEKFYNNTRDDNDLPVHTTPYTQPGRGC